jgi:hypothetical protein
MVMRSTRAVVLALLLGSAAVFAPMPAAGAQASAVPGNLQSVVDDLLADVGQVTGSLAPQVTFTVDEEASLYSFGAAAGITGIYNCTKTIDLPPLSHLTKQSLEFQLNGAYLGPDNKPVIAQAYGGIDGFDVVCDGMEHEYSITGLVTNGIPFEEGSGEAIVRMTACDLLGCTTASFDPTLAMTGDGFSSAAGATAAADCSYVDAGNGEPITADAGSTFTDSRGLTYRVGDDCTLSAV